MLQRSDLVAEILVHISQLLLNVLSFIVFVGFLVVEQRVDFLLELKHKLALLLEVVLERFHLAVLLH